MDQNAKHNPHCVYVINYHLVWTLARRYRKKILVEPIATRLKQLFREIATPSGFEIIADEVMPDHVHLFVSAPPKYAPSELVRLFKGITSRRLTQERLRANPPCVLGTARYPMGRRLLCWHGRSRQRRNHQTLHRRVPKSLA